MHLNRPAIVTAALKLLNQYGLGDVTMRRVATSLNAAPGALYWHVSNKQDLIAALAEEILSPILTSEDAPSSDAVGLVLSLRTELLRWRDGAEVVSAGLSQPDSEVRAELIELVDATCAHQVPEASAAQLRAAAEAIVHIVLGATLLEQSQVQMLAAESAASVESSGTEKADRLAAQSQSQLVAGVDLILAGLSPNRD